MGKRIVTPVRIASKEKHSGDLQSVTKFGKLSLVWLNEYSGTNIDINEKDTFIFINGKRYELDAAMNQLDSYVNSYERLDLVRGPCWRIEHHAFYRRDKMRSIFLLSNWHTDVVFDDEYLALQFKLISPWLVS